MHVLGKIFAPVIKLLAFFCKPVSVYSYLAKQENLVETQAW